MWKVAQSEVRSLKPQRRVYQKKSNVYFLADRVETQKRLDGTLFDFIYKFYSKVWQKKSSPLARF
jgi:hypothetical protein